MDHEIGHAVDLMWERRAMERQEAMEQAAEVVFDDDMPDKEDEEANDELLKMERAEDYMKTNYNDAQAEDENY